MFEIYLITNQINEKRYVGQTVKGLKRRFLQHINDARSGSGIYLHRAIRKYGEDRFTISLLATAKEREDLNRLEEFWIKFLNTRSPNGYNSTDGGDGTSGFIQREETKQKISASNTGKYVGDKSYIFRHDINNKNVAELYQQGKSAPQIAKLLGTTKGTIQNRLRSMGIPSRSVVDAQKIRRSSFSTKEMILLFDKGLSYKEIAHSLGCSAMCVYYRIKNEGISRPVRADQDKVVDLYLAGWALPKIAGEIGVSKSRIHQILTERNVHRCRRVSQESVATDLLPVA